jgi:pyridinium-3,5-biscarboxylic acid mononucleotide sulfurtransferase
VDKDLLSQKTKALHTLLQKYLPMAVAFSGGVDSTYLLAEVYDLADDKSQVVAITADSPIHPKGETESAQFFCREKGIRHIVIETMEMDSLEFTANPSTRCYSCKKIIFSSIVEAAKRLGIQNVAHAVNVDDLSEFRPGLAAAEEMGVLAPLAEAGLSKAEIRLLSRQKGLVAWDQPASGCLATRIPYGNEITKEKLERIESAEQSLADLGFPGSRVRYYDDLAKIEIRPDDLKKIMEDSVRDAVACQFKKIGFLYVSVDIEGYTSGRLNRSLRPR